MSEIKYKIINGKQSSIRLASPDDPIYKMGCMFGIQKLHKSTKVEDKETDLKSQEKEQEEQELKGGI